MDIWKYVSEHSYDSPDNQISLLLEKSKKYSRKHRGTLKILDAGGGLEDRSDFINKFGERIVVDIEAGKNVDVVADIHKMPFPNSSFDMIVLFMVMEHLHDPLHAIRECQRVLKKTGVMLITTVQYWHTHDHPNDYYRFTKEGIRYITGQSNLEIKEIWSMGGPFLVLYHVIELNLPSFFRKIFMLTCPVFNYLDKLVFDHQDKRKNSDSVGWSLIVQKK